MGGFALTESPRQRCPGTSNSSLGRSRARRGIQPLVDRRAWTRGLLAVFLSSFSRPSKADGRRPTRALVVPKTFFLEADPKQAERQRLIHRLASEQGLRICKLEDVLSSLNRRARAEGTSLRLFTDNERKRRERYGFQGAFTWNRQDEKTTAWYPQGITGSGDAWPSGTVGGRRVLLVSWYARKNEQKGARVTLVDVTSLNDVRYRHLLLVEPVEKRGKVDFAPVRIHAGGIALYRNLLYVADTHRGLRVFDTNTIFRTASDPKKARVGVIGGAAYAFDYRYAVPLLARYQQPVGQNMRFSFVSLDRTSVPHSLWVGEYHEGTSEGFASHFALDPTTARLETAEGERAASRSVLRFNRERTQGFVATHRSYVLTHTYARDPYRLHIQTPVGYASIKAPYGLEDLSYDPTLDRIWMLTEHPKSRAVFFNTAPDELK